MSMKNYQVKHKTGWIGEVVAIEDGCVSVRKGKETKDYMFPDVFLPDEAGLIFEILDEEFQKVVEEKTKEQEEKAARAKREAEEKEALKQKRQEEIERRKEEARKNAEAERERRAGVLQKEGRFVIQATRPVEHEIAKKEVRKSQANLTGEQKNALEVLESGANVFLSGEAGTGKSFVINEYLYRNQQKNIIVCAPTGIAAINVGGTTLHRMFRIPLDGGAPGAFNEFPDEAIIKADIVVIDEISMLRMDNFEYVIRTIRRAEDLSGEIQKKAMGVPGPVRRKQVIVTGDFFQLPPVISKEERPVLDRKWGEGVMGCGFAFRSELWQEMNFRPVILKTVMRQKDGSEFAKHLNQIRHGDPSGLAWFNGNAKKEPLEGAITLCGKKDEVKRINDRETEKLPGEEMVYYAVATEGLRDSDKVTEDALRLKVGMQVMTLVNHPDDLYQNGSIGVIERMTENYVTVRFDDDRVIPIGRFTWDIYGYEVQKDKVEKVVLGSFQQLPLMVAYAITIHKSQGQTYDAVNILPTCFDPGQLYVALSRVRSIGGMSLAKPVSAGALKTSSEVARFYREQEDRSCP